MCGAEYFSKLLETGPGPRPGHVTSSVGPATGRDAEPDSVHEVVVNVVNQLGRGVGDR